MEKADNRTAGICPSSKKKSRSLSRRLLSGAICAFSKEQMMEAHGQNTPQKGHPDDGMMPLCFSISARHSFFLGEKLYTVYNPPPTHTHVHSHLSECVRTHLHVYLMVNPKPGWNSLSSLTHFCRWWTCWNVGSEAVHQSSKQRLGYTSFYKGHKSSCAFAAAPGGCFLHHVAHVWNRSVC